MILRIADCIAETCNACADFVRRLQGWRAYGAAVFSGAASALAFAPFGLIPLLLISLVLLVWLIDGAQARKGRVWRSALVGWCYGFGQFLVGLYWVAYAFLVDPLQHAWQIPFVLLLLPGGLALFLALAGAVAGWLWRPGLSRIFIFTAAYSIAEWLRGHILTGFPWNLAGYGWGALPAILQSVAVFGVYGLTLLTILFGASLALLADKSRARLLPLIMGSLFVGLWIGGAVRLSRTPVQFVPGVHLRLVQPNVAQADKYLPELRMAHWQELLDLSTVHHGPRPTEIIWPEAAPPFLLARVPDAMAAVQHLATGGTVLMTGAARAELSPAGRPLLHNSFYVFAKGRLLDVYDKSHLVPFGEYVPFPDTLHFLGIDRIVDQPGSFASGDGPHAYSIPGAPPIGPLICYEVIFPGDVTGGSRPEWLVNVTDDSWFGPESSTGPYQHFLIARVRAIEEGLPVARAANTGISAVVDPLGRVIAELGVNKAGVVDAPLPKADLPTVFARFHHLLFWMMLAMCAGIGLAAQKREK